MRTGLIKIFYPGGIPGRTGGIPGIVGGTPGIMGGIPKTKTSILETQVCCHIKKKEFM